VKIDWSVLTHDDLDHIHSMYVAALERAREEVRSLRFMLVCVLQANGGKVYIPNDVICDVTGNTESLAISEYRDTDGVSLSVREVV
jgi:hypothetical protein